MWDHRKSKTNMYFEKNLFIFYSKHLYQIKRIGKNAMKKTEINVTHFSTSSIINATHSIMTKKEESGVSM